MEPEQIKQEVVSRWQKVKALPWVKYIVIASMVIGAITALVIFKKSIQGIFWPTDKPVTVLQPATPASGMQSAPTVEVTPQVPLKTYDKKLAAKKISLPPEVVENPKLALLTTSKTDTGGGNSVTTAAVLDTTTGVTTTYDKQERSLFAFGGAGAIGLRGGVGLGGITGTVYAKQNLIRISGVTVAGYAEITGSETRQPDIRGMIDVELFAWK